MGQELQNCRIVVVFGIEIKVMYLNVNLLF
jgi:hypothetical protein